MNGVTPHSATAHALNADGSQGKPLAVEQTDDGWRVPAGRTSRAGFIYQVDLNQVQGLEDRRAAPYLHPRGRRRASCRVRGLPAAGRREVDNITVTMHNPHGLQVLVPWPALVKKRPGPVRQRRRRFRPRQANVSPGQGFLPAPRRRHHRTIRSRQGRSRPPRCRDNLLFHPQDLADLNNSLLICGDLQVAIDPGPRVRHPAGHRSHLEFPPGRRPGPGPPHRPHRNGLLRVGAHRPDHRDPVGQPGHRRRKIRHLRRAHRQFGAGHDGPRHHLGRTRGPVRPASSPTKCSTAGWAKPSPSRIPTCCGSPKAPPPGTPPGC